MRDRGVFDVLVESEMAPPRCRVEEEYGAALVVGDGRVAVNFVSTIDGIVSFGPTASDSRAVGGLVVADRTLMAMLRAVAGVIVIGVGTLRATLNHQWTAQAILPDRAADLAELRAAAGLPAEPAPLLVVSGGGDIPAGADAVARPAVPVHVLTTAGVLPAKDALNSGAHARGHLNAQTIIEAAISLGSEPVLCEGGPHLFGSLLDGGVAAELFLTVAPQLAGRVEATPERRSLVEGTALPPFARPAQLRSARRAADHLLLRYAIDATAPQ
jgi:riboflavin biosynthesis pyrimidine reductase